MNWQIIQFYREIEGQKSIIKNYHLFYQDFCARGCERAKCSGFSAVEVLEKTIWQFQWLLLLQSGGANQKAKVGAPCVHQNALVEGRGTQLWVASFYSDQSLRLPRCCSTFSSISGMSVFVVGWWLVWGHSDQQIWSSETNGSRGGTIWRLPPRFYRPKFQRPRCTNITAN